MKYIEHLTKDGDRWDLIAYNYYGNPFLYQDILEANPDIPFVPVLESGLIVRVPVPDETETIITKENLPPWKQ